MEPSIFGTLFERILDPRKRAQIGAHYTSKEDILLVIEPVVMQPLRRQWQEIQDKIAPQLETLKEEKDRKKRSVHAAPIAVALEQYRQMLGKQRILDPACGSGNFLYVALQQLLDLEDEVVRFAARHDIAMNPVPHVRPTQLHGIEINPYAAELAQVVIWIGYLQWLHVHGIDNPKRPILDKLQTVECRDAILDLRDQKHPIAATWPTAEFIVGNPPFLGSKLFREAGLPNDYVDAVYASFELPKTSDLCCYWFEIGRQELVRNPGIRIGLLATQGIRGRENRTVLQRIQDVGDIFLAWSDREWVLDGAAVNVSIIGFDSGRERLKHLDGQVVSEISSNLRSDVDTTTAAPLKENSLIGWSIGTQKGGPFEFDVQKAREIVSKPNPNGKPGVEVVKPWRNASDITGRLRGLWVIDFGPFRSADEAAGYEAAFEYARKHVKPERDSNRRDSYRLKWWIHQEPRGELRPVLEADRVLLTPRIAKHRVWVRTSSEILPDCALVVFSRSDDYFFGIMHASLQEVWALRMGTQLEDRPRYTPTTCFETFPLPWPPGKEPSRQPSPGVPGEGVKAYVRIAAAAKGLDEQRERWLNPPEWIEPIEKRIDAEDDFADVPAEARALVRRSAIMAAAAKDARLKKRTLTNLYNERPTWLKLAHEQLDRAVLAAYAAVDPAGGWSEDWAEVWVDTGAGQPLPKDNPLIARRAEVEQRVLANLLRLNHTRAGKVASEAAPRKERKKQVAKLRHET